MYGPASHPRSESLNLNHMYANLFRSKPISLQHLGASPARIICGKTPAAVPASMIEEISFVRIAARGASPNQYRTSRQAG
jgi:hypothetical protein